MKVSIPKRLDDPLPSSYEASAVANARAWSWKHIGVALVYAILELAKSVRERP